MLFYKWHVFNRTEKKISRGTRKLAQTSLSLSLKPKGENAKGGIVIELLRDPKAKYNDICFAKNIICNHVYSHFFVFCS